MTERRSLPEDKEGYSSGLRGCLGKALVPRGSVGSNPIPSAKKDEEP